MGYNLHHKSWVRVKEDLVSSDTVIMPLGSLEAHGAHKPVGCCYLLAEAASREIGERTSVMVAPVIPFGVSDSYMNFPGTVTVSIDTLSRYVYESSKSLIRAGYRKIVFLSAHGGDNLSVLRELSFRLREEHRVLCAVVHVWGVISKMAPSKFWGEGHRAGHGGEPTTSVMLYLHPELVDMSKAELIELRQPMEGFETKSYDVHEHNGVPYGIYLFAEEVEPSGFMGDPTRASAEKGEQLYRAALDHLVGFVEAFKRLDPALS